MRRTTREASQRQAESREYQSWEGMIDRCENPKNPRFDRYGGRSISVCPKWRASFLAFLADMGSRPEGTTLDRIDVNGDYEPGNCRWATYTEQSRNVGLRKDNASGIAGVCWSKSRGKWEVRIAVKGRHIHLGYASSLEEAGAMRMAGEATHWEKKG